MKRITLAALCGALSLTASSAFAQVYPSKPIRMIVPAAAGGSTDIGARLVARVMGAELGQTIVVENKGGGGGRIGPTEVARAPADGYTLLYGNSITHALLPATAKTLAYDNLKDFAPVAGVFWYSTLVVCHPALPFNDLAGLLAYAKKSPGRLKVATAGVGSGNHFSSELIASMAQVEMTHIPYKGNAPGLQDVMGGIADCMHLGEAKPHIDAGRVKVIATTGRLRDPRFPNVPTVDEAGLKGFDVTWWQAVFAPAGTPPEVLAKLSQAARKAAEDPKVKAEMFDGGFVPQYVAPADLTRRMQVDMATFRKIAADAKLELE